MADSLGYDIGRDMGRYIRRDGLSQEDAQVWLDEEVDHKQERGVSLTYRLAYANGFWAGYHNLKRVSPETKREEVTKTVFVLFPMKSSELHHVLDRSRVFTTLEAAQAAIPAADWVRDGSDHWLNINVDAERAFIVRKTMG